MDAGTALLNAFARQAGWCRRPSPFSARVLDVTVAWLRDDAPALAAQARIAQDPLAAAVPLRWLAGLHHLALLGSAPWSTLWPPASQALPEDTVLRAAVTEAWTVRRPHMEAALALPPQTNEVQRGAALLPGLLHVAARTGRPLALLEIGASAGLNLWCDRYRHDHGRWAWGDPASPLTLGCDWQGALPRQAALQVLTRAACDVDPMDLDVPGEALRLASFVWADQRERLARLHAAVAVAKACMSSTGVRVRRQGAARFVMQQLARRPPGLATVLMHSVMWQYMAAPEQAAIAAALDDAGATATAESPLAWLRLEPPEMGRRLELRCCRWPGGEDALLATCDAHGACIDWVAQ